MGETDQHRDITVYLIEALKLWFRGRKNVYVSGDLMMYYVEGNAGVSVSPDVFVVKGVPQVSRRVYKVWEERKAPCAVIEVSSKSTKSEDLTTKFALYRDVLKVAEYYIYDPLREYLPHRLRAWALKRDLYVERRVMNGRIHSRELGLDLVDDQGMLRLIDPETGRALPALAQAEDARREAENAQRLEAEARREAENAQRLEAEARRLEAEARRLEAEARCEAEKALKAAQEEILRLRVALDQVHRKRNQ